MRRLANPVRRLTLILCALCLTLALVLAWWPWEAGATNIFSADWDVGTDPVNTDGTGDCEASAYTFDSETDALARLSRATDVTYNSTVGAIKNISGGNGYVTIAFSATSNWSARWAFDLTAEDLDTGESWTLAYLQGSDRKGEINLQQDAGGNLELDFVIRTTTALQSVGQVDLGVIGSCTGNWYEIQVVYAASGTSTLAVFRNGVQVGSTVSTAITATGQMTSLLFGHITGTGTITATTVYQDELCMTNTATPPDLIITGSTNNPQVF